MTTGAPPPLLTEADSALVGVLRPSPNHGERRSGAVIDTIILHYTGMADGPSAVDWLCDPRSQVSCHYVVEENGAILQLVAEARRAWHAGRSFWAGEIDLNSVSIGIEIVNPGRAGGLPPYPATQVEAVIDLCRDLMGRHPIDPARVLGHSDIAPGRKDDPGEQFPWATLHAAGVGLWVAPSPADEGPSLAPGDAGAAVLALQRSLAAHGYGLPATGDFDAATTTVVKAFQLHFRPARVDGIADAATILTLAALLAERDRTLAGALLPPAAEDAREADDGTPPPE